MTAGFLVIGLLKTPLRWSGAALIPLAASAPLPDVLIGADGHSFAVRGADGRLAIHQVGGDSFAIKEWLAADADGRDVHDKSLGQGINCDPSGCIGKLADGALVSYAVTPESLRRRLRPRRSGGGDPRRPPGGLSGHGDWAGGLARAGRAGAAPKNFDRPWAPAPAPRESLAAAPLSGSDESDASGRASRDATPRADDIEADQ